MESSIFLNIGLILAIAIGIAFLVQLLRQPLIVSYILTGIVCGPIFFNLINSSHEYFNIFAEFGVILLLFLVGLSLNFDYLKRIGKVAVLTGVGQVIFTSFVGFFILLLFGFDKMAAIFLAVSITFSSTIIIIKLLTDKDDLRTVYGRYTIGLMLVQDIIAIFLMMVLPTLRAGDSLLITGLALLAKILVVLSIIYFLSKVVLPVILERVAKNGEFLFIFTLAWCFAIAGFGEWSGISVEVGAIIAGLSLGSSIYQAEISSRIKPLRDFFIALFFIILGSEMNVDNFSQVVLPSLALSAFVLIGNPLILYFIYRQMKFTRRSSFLAGLTAAQVSEFGFVFLFVAYQMGYIENSIISIFTLVALITIFISSYLITYNHQIYEFIKPLLKMLGEDIHEKSGDANVKFDVLVIGYHRLGWKICEELAKLKIDYAVVDFNPEIIKRLEEDGIPHFFGDATDIELLNELPIRSTKMVISTLPRAVDQFALLQYIKRKNKKCVVISNLSHVKFLDEMYERGSDYVLIPHLIGAKWLSDVLKKNSWTKKTFQKLKQKQAGDLRFRPVKKKPAKAMNT